MRAKDLMTTDVICADPDMDVRQAAETMLRRRISGLPVVQPPAGLVGMVTQADLFRRRETGTEHHHSWWLEMFTSSHRLADEYAREHGRRVGDVMARDLVTVTEETTLAEVAEILERHRIRRVPVLRGNQLVGIVSRSDLLRALVGAWLTEQPAETTDDRALRHRILAEIRHAHWGGRAPFVTVRVERGAVELWGTVDDPAERRALRALVENVPGVNAVADKLGVVPPWFQRGLP